MLALLASHQVPAHFRKRNKEYEHIQSQIKIPTTGVDIFILVLEVGLEPTKPKGRRFTVSRDCHYTIPA